MYIYYVFIFALLCVASVNSRTGNIRIRMHNYKGFFSYPYFVFIFLLFFSIMGLKKYTVGGDWVSYLRYKNEIYTATTSWMEIFSSSEFGFALQNKVLGILKVGDQGYILLTGLFFSIVFCLFFFEYSINFYYALFLHLTIGMFTMSMSGIRQTYAVCFCLIAFHMLIKRKLLLSVCFLLLAISYHNSAVCFSIIYPVFYFKIEVTFNKGLLLWFVIFATLFIRPLLTSAVLYFMPSRYDASYSDTSSWLLNKINPLLVVIALLIPLACLFCQKVLATREVELNKTMFSVFFILSCVNAFCNILSLNFNLLGRLSYYFVTFAVVLIVNSVFALKKKGEFTIAFMSGLILPLYEFVKGTPGGSLQIDNFKFFFQG